VPAGITVRVSVIDNAADESARAVVDAYRCTGKFSADYVVEPRRGIPCARNRALDHAQRMEAAYLAFIDDDEWVTPEWLSELLNCSRQMGTDSVISGAVKSVVPDGVSQHISYFFTREKGGRTGDRLEACATNNVLIPMAVVVRYGLRFDESNPLAGGTDTIFFVNAVRHGVAIYKCKKALVYEHVPLSRANLRWLAKRKYRAGITDAGRKIQKGRKPIAIFFSATVSIVLQSLLCLTGLALLQRRRANRAWLKVSKSAGTIMGLLGREVESYREIDR